jgi:hypothetical protein
MTLNSGKTLIEGHDHSLARPRVSAAHASMVRQAPRGVNANATFA